MMTASGRPAASGMVAPQSGPSEALFTTGKSSDLFAGQPTPTRALQPQPYVECSVFGSRRPLRLQQQTRAQAACSQAGVERARRSTG